MADPGRKKTISDAEFLREMRLLPDPVVTAGEVSERVDMTRQGVNSRLDEMVDSGYVKRKEVGSRAVVYWLTDSGKEKATEAG